MPTRHGVLDIRQTRYIQDIHAANDQRNLTGPQTNYNWTSIRSSDRNCEVLELASVQMEVRRTIAASTPGEARLEYWLKYQNGFFSDRLLSQLLITSNVVGAKSKVAIEEPLILMRALFDNWPPYIDAVQGHTYVAWYITDTSIGGEVQYNINVLGYATPTKAPQTILPW